MISMKMFMKRMVDEIEDLEVVIMKENETLSNREYLKKFYEYLFEFDSELHEKSKS